VTVPTVSALDLDFFLNPNCPSSNSSTTLNADSLLESIERELLSSPAKTATQQSTVQSPPVDVWGHNHFSTAQGPPAAAANVLDFLK
jgi:hypothetical protein